MTQTKTKNTSFIRTILICAGIILLRVTGLLNVNVVEGQSMYPNFDTGDYVIVSNIPSLHRYDIVTATSPTTHDVIKRIIGLPGDVVQVSGRDVYVNGNLTDESFINEGECMTVAAGRYTLKDNEYFIVGDNRCNSSDSRMYGPVTKGNIKGRVLIRVPLSKLFK